MSAASHPQPVFLGDLSLEGVDLTNCDREPIHMPGSIQPHGVLIVVEGEDLVIRQVSQNAEALTGIPPAEWFDQPLAHFFTPESVDTIRACLVRDFEAVNPLPVTLKPELSTASFSAVVHRTPSAEIVVELELGEDADAPGKDLQSLGQGGNFFQFYHRVKQTLTKIQQAASLQALCGVVVQEVKQLTGFDRVMVYRFDKSGAGEVIAEAKASHQEAFLGLRYPDSDIPKQAKFLYTLSWLRLIPDVNYAAAPLLASPHQPAPDPLDMRYSILRSVSPMHIEYLKNMGVGASMSVSLIQNGQLWGLIACHHDRPRFVPYPIRTVCEFIGQLMSTELANKEANENLDYQFRLKDLQGHVLERLSRSADFFETLTTDPDQLLALAGAQGAVVTQADDIRIIGQTPDEGALQLLLKWLEPQFVRDLFMTDSLPRLYPEAESYAPVASGLLAIAISKIQKRYILWFRPECLQTVTWAGNPEKPNQVEADGTITITPRTSFAAWQDIVRHTSRPWLPCEVQGAVEVRQTIVDIVLRQADELASINLELQQSNSELDAFAYIASHDLKEPLRGIHNYATFLLEDYANVLDEDGVDRLNTLTRLTKRMESLIESLLKFSRLGRQEIQMQQINLNHLVHDIQEIFAMNPEWQGCSIRIPQDLPVVWGDRILIEEIFTNLISNAFKYNDNPEKWVEINWQEPQPEQPHLLTLTLQDNGIGIREKHLDTIFRIFKRLHPPKKYSGGTGAGLTIVKKIVERHGGTIVVKSVYREGSTFSFTLPSQKPLTAESRADSPD
ncbi:MAG: ATP-binding protein [Prochlorotrichaceae cyanobacterium]